MLDSRFYDRRYYIGATLFVFFVSLLFSLNLSAPVSIQKETNSIDFQSVAVNLVKYNKFPYSGFYGPINSYKIDTNVNLSLSAGTYLKVVTENPPVIQVTQTPLYSLFIALIYKLTGVEPASVRIVQIFMVCFISVFMVYLCIYHIGATGLFAGSMAGLLFYYYKYNEAYEISPTLFLNFILFVTLLITTISSNIWSNKKGILIGILLASMVMIKGHVIFIPAFYLAYALYISFFVYKNHYYIYLLSGMLIIMLPWFVYANVAMQNSSTERHNWSYNIKRKITNGKVEKIHLKQPYTKEDTVLMLNKIRTDYALYADDGIVLMVKQVNRIMGNQLIWGHNELCVDGQVHEEADYVSSLYANTHHQKESGFARVFYFYKDNPEFIYKIALGKLTSVSTPEYKYFLIAIICLGILAIYTITSNTILRLVFGLLIAGTYSILPIQSAILIVLLMSILYLIRLKQLVENYHIPILILFTITNNLLILILMAGVNRFAESIDSISIFSAFLLSGLILNRLILNYSKQ